MQCSKSSLFDHLVGGGEQRLRECQAKRFSRLEVEYKIELCALFASLPVILSRRRLPG